MGEEHRGSSEGGTAMMMVAILGGLLVFGCCAGAVVLGLGGSVMWLWSAPMDLQMQPPPPPIAVPVDPQVTKALDDLNKDLEPLKVAPDDGTQAAPIEPGSEKPEAAPSDKEK